MKITAIRSHNLASIRASVIEPDPSAHAILLCGKNGAGKSSLLDAIRYALSDELPEGVRYKKDFASVITQGEQSGSFQLAYEHDDRRQESTVNLKNGTRSGAAIPELGQQLFVLNPAQYLAMDAQKRRKVLFDRARISLKADDIAATLVKEGNAQRHVDAVMVAIRSGLDQAAKMAKERASEERGGWQAITGETYGTAKAEGWKPAAPADAEDPAPLRARLKELTGIQVRAVNLRDALKRDDDQHVRASNLSKEADTVSGLQADLNILDTRITESADKLKSMEVVATGKKGWTATCPCCDSTLFVEDGTRTLVEFSADTSANAKVAAAGAEAERGVLAGLRADRAKLASKLDSAKAAARALQSLPDRPSQKDLDESAAAAQRAIAAVLAAETELVAAESAWQQVVQQQAVAEKAAAHHANHVGFSKLSAALEVMPARFMQAALSGINEMLAAASKMMDFPVAVSMGEDMELRYGSIPYSRASESQKWRAQLVLGLTLGQETGGVLLMDRFDCIQIQDRGAILVALGAQTHVQVILGATLKAAPLSVPPGVSAHWIGD